jgi:phage FluMu gp28-like protein
MKASTHDFFLPYQQAWIEDSSSLKIIEKSRQIGLTYADAFDSVLKASHRHKPADVWVSSRDEATARLYLQHCKRWAQALDLGARELGEQIIHQEKDLKAQVLSFNTGCCIYSHSSTPDALASRTGHVKLDEFALHKDQRELFRVAKGCTQWGYQLAILSTHRGPATVFNEMLRKIKEQGNPMGFSHHRVTLDDAVNQGLVERINVVSGRNESRQAFLQRIRTECLDEEQWLQEYCCQPTDDSTAFITWEMITACEVPNCLKPFSYLTDDDDDRRDRDEVRSSPSPHGGEGRGEVGPLYVGVDVARKHDLCVIDVCEKIGDVCWDRLRVELRDTPFAQIEEELFRILKLPGVKRCCIDATGLGMQLAERAKARFGWKVEPITFTSTLKEQIAFALRNAFEDRKLRIPPDPALRADLRGIKKCVTAAGNIRFMAEGEDSHCDRFWAKALRHHAASTKRGMIGGIAIRDHFDDFCWTRNPPFIIHYR